jgi:hypothetical protein
MSKSKKATPKKRATKQPTLKPLLMAGHYCFQVVESSKDPKLGYRPVIIVEGTKGYFKQGGRGVHQPAPWYWGLDREAADAMCKKANKKLGLFQHEIDRIVASSFEEHQSA